MIWFGFGSAFILGILSHRGKKVKTSWKVESIQTSVQVSTATLSGCKGTAISHLKITQTNVFFQQKSKHKCGKGLRGHVYHCLTFPRRRSHRSCKRNLTSQNIPMAMNMLLNKSASWEDFSLTGRTTLIQHCLLLFQVSAANRNIVVCQERWAGNIFSYPQALLILKFSHPNTEKKSRNLKLKTIQKI